MRGGRAVVLVAAVLLCLCVGGARADDVCKEGHCRPCESDHDCKLLHACVPQDDGLYCMHKGLLPLHPLDVLGAVLMFSGGFLASVGGIGGGGVFAPLLMLVGKFTPHGAVPLSKAMILGGSIGGFIINVDLRHPYADRPLVDYEASVLLEPLTLAGTILGVYCNVVFPEWIVVILITVLLLVLTVRGVRSGWRVWREEKKEERMRSTNGGGGGGGGRGGGSSDEFAGVEMGLGLGLSQAEIEAEGGGGMLASVAAYAASDAGSSGGESVGEQDDIAVEALEHEPLLGGAMGSDADAVEEIRNMERRTPVGSILLLFLLWVAVFGMTVLTGNPNLGGVRTCSNAYYWLISVEVLVVVLFTLWVGRRIRSKHRRKTAVSFPFAKGDLRWTRRNVLIGPVVCMIAGAAAGLVGIGGGMIKVPLLMDLGAVPESATATASFMILFTSASTVLNFLTLGTLPHDYGLFYAVLGFASTVAGQLTFSRVFKRHRKSFYISLSIAVVSALSATLLIYMGIRDVVVDVHLHRDLWFNDYCPAPAPATTPDIDPITGW